MPKGIPLTPEELSKRKQEIAETAMELFSKKGYLGASMRELAQMLEMGKSSLYDFFGTKDAIVTYALEEKITVILRKATEIAKLDEPPYNRLYQLMELELGFLEENRVLITLMNTEPAIFSVENQEQIQTVRHKYQDLMRSILEEGIQKGLFRKVDTLFTARLMMNSLITICFATRPSGESREMLCTAMDIFLNGLHIFK
ncbi:MAG: TetR/AcrR family transcriptional regulator [Ruminiclostridium sp.]|nr:TetR/AcrR family transcriptional regulator [Ruminiclostridium sp.]